MTLALKDEIRGGREGEGRRGCNGEGRGDREGRGPLRRG